MDKAVVSSAPLAVPQHFGVAERLRAMPPRARMGLAVGIAALAAVAVALALAAGQGDYRVLYPNLSEKDAGAVTAQLSQMNVPYKLSGNGLVMVPASQVPDVRLKLATAGLPKGSVSGFELMDSARFGQTQFQERLTFQRGLEGELTRSITSLAAVETARVHLALPNQNGFFREQQKPSASVLLTLRAGRTLDRAQVAGIVHLVSSSVPELDPKAVSVLDQTGNLLTNDGANPAAGLDAMQLQYVSQVEGGYAKRIYQLLEPIVGRDNLRATVTADVDFSQSEATSEEFRPNQGSDASISIRSQQTTEQGGSSGVLPSGVPGAASNQPPVAATAPLTGASQPLQGSPLGGGTANLRREAVTNYEVDKTVRVTRNATGVVKRLNAAVVVNNRSATDAKGKTTLVPLATDEIDKLTALVRETIGFKQERGDSVKVINAPFKIETQTTVDVPWWKQPDALDVLRSFAMPGALSLVAVLVFLGLVRPGLRAFAVAFPPPPPVRLEAVEDEPASLPVPALSLPAPHLNEHLEQVRKMARDNPAAVAGIIRSWSGTEATANKG
jgi:flagellar M-ring protein FliF